MDGFKLMEEIKVADGIAVVRYPTEDEYDPYSSDFCEYISVRVGPDEVATVAIHRDPEAEAKICAAGYQAVCDAVLSEALKGTFT